MCSYISKNHRGGRWYRWGAKSSPDKALFLLDPLTIGTFSTYILNVYFYNGDAQLHFFSIFNLFQLSRSLSVCLLLFDLFEIDPAFVSTALKTQ